MKHLILVILTFCGIPSPAEITDAKTAAIVKAIDGEKVKVNFNNKDYWIPKKDVIGDSKNLKAGQPVMISLKSFEIEVK